MELSRNHYRKFLIDEVIRSLNATVFAAYSEVIEFSKTREFEESYKKWVYLNAKNKKKVFRPKSMKEIFQGMDIKC